MSDATMKHSGEGMWPELEYGAWKDTCATLHMWTQIVGKIRLAQTPLENHWWNVPLYVTARGLTTSAMPHGARTFQIDFDFIAHRLDIACSDGNTASLPLEPRSVADFYRAVMETLHDLDLEVDIWTMPVEVENPIRFEEDREHASYDAPSAHKFWRVLTQADRVFKEFRARFIGKASPVHFFWGSFDLAATRFNGQRAPERAGADPITREAYSHEAISHGFWPGSAAYPSAAFYAYAAPEPSGMSDAPLRPSGALYSAEMKEFILPYDVVRRADSPSETLLDFLQSTYEASANLARWDRESLDRA